MPAVGTNASVTWGDTEGSAMTDNSSSVTFGQNTYTVKRMNAMVKLSREIVSDANPDIVTTVVELFQEAIARENDKVIAIGSGTGRPTGLYSASGITNVSITSLTYANIVKLKHSVDIRYHSSPSFRWTMNQNVLAALMQVVDGNGLPIFVDGGVPINGGALTGRVSTILGVPYSIEASLPNNYLGIGDLRYYCWFDRQQLAVESTMEGGDSFAAHQMWIKFTQRCDGKPILPVTKPMARTRVLAGVTSLV
jgi:HK97 family phage major capsid protein